MCPEPELHLLAEPPESPAGPNGHAMADGAATVRGFNRFYTGQVGALQEGLLGSPFSLTQSRVLYELGTREQLTATELAGVLQIDAGYLSRLLRKFAARKLVARRRSSSDRRQVYLSLTPTGRRAFEALDTQSQASAAQLLDALDPVARRRLLGAMQTIESILSPTQPPTASVGFVLRDPLPGDLGWVIHRQATLYAREYRFNQRFEGLIAGVIAEYVASFNPDTDRCWIAERDGAVIGSVFVVRQADDVARLRLLYVEPSSRGLGVGRTLVRECLRFARQKGYRTMTLWTHSVLAAARGIYESEGFRIVDVHQHDDFGHMETGETWELTL